MKSIKRRIKVVGSTLQITKAMEMVSSSKLRRAKAQTEKMRPYFNALNGMLSDIAAEKKDFSTIFTVPRDEVKNRLFIVIAGDRGLAGGYNSNIVRLVGEHTASSETKPKIIAIGKTTVDYFKKNQSKYELIGEYPHFSENIKASRCGDIADCVTDLFRTGEVDEVWIFYTAFISALNQEITSKQLLPFIPAETVEKQPDFTRYDPSPEAVFDRIIPKMLLSIISCACVEAYASEQSARRNAMENASDNAEEMIENLSLQYNRLRQEKITNEINEIVGGANAIS